MNRKPLTQESFSFISWTPKKIHHIAELALSTKKEDFARIKAISEGERTFENTVYALENAGAPYDDQLHLISLLGELSPKKPVRDAAHEALTTYGQATVDIDYDVGLYKALCSYRDGAYKKEKKILMNDDIKLFEDTLLEYKRAGFDKDESTRKKIKVLLKKISKLSLSFGKQLNDYQDYILVEEAELDGMSARYKDSLPRDTKSKKYRISLSYPHIGPFLSFATNRARRKELAEKDLQKGGRKNLKTIKEIILLRKQLATLLGYTNHALFRTETRMAKTPSKVIEFLKSIEQEVKKKAASDMKTLRTHAKALFISTLEHYDTAFVAASLKKKLYDIDPEALRPYFPLPHVMKELFGVVHALYGITIREEKIQLWHKDATLYSLSDEDGIVGYIACDMYPREGKFGHAAMLGTFDGKLTSFAGNEYQTPLATLMCNFPAPYKKRGSFVPSLLSIGEVETLYHEVGHALHQVLSKVRRGSQSGTNVVFDFVETPSQFMENFVWNKAALRSLSRHYETGKHLDENTIDNLLSAKHFLKGYQYMRQIIYSMLDFELHTGKIKDGSSEYVARMKKYFGIALPKAKVLFPAGFGHLVGYDAGYYSYLWALVYADDVYSLFKKAIESDGGKYGSHVREVGLRLRKEVLEKGSSEDELKLLTKFLKRAPNNKAFLKEVIG